ncbi:MAG: adenylate/guanylate cyclase domain-containing protein, partial [Campylobacterota bacterium]|nr:adenylate/guanylate cyclase domain-containing protein [Campylobacterota bacterium]
MKFNLKKFAYYSLAVLSVFMIVVTTNIYFNNFTTSLDNQIRDYMFISRGELSTKDSSVVIIDIDEKSLNQLGQWPWSRDKVSQILKNLSLANIGAIGLDIVFAELDNSSPATIFKKYNITNIKAPDFDEELNYMVKNTPTILGYSFELTTQKFTKQESINIPAIIVEKNKKQLNEFLITAKGTILNHDKLQKSAYSSGFFNVIADTSGVIRKVPLVIRYKEQIFPSLALEIIRASMGIKAIVVNYSNLGIESIQIGEFKIPTDRHGRLVVNYRGYNHTFKYFSAIDIYNGNFNKNDIAGKVALIGTTATGLSDLRSIPFEPVFPGVEVHANVIDNIINGDFITLPSWIDGANLFLILITIVMTFTLITFSPLWINPFILFLLSTSILLFAYYILFQQGVIINSFLMLLALFLSVLVATFMDYIFEIKKEQEIKNKFASKVSKEVMEKLIAIEGDSFNPINKEITVFFSNIRNFSYISESSPNATILINFLNEYVEPMSKIIIKNKGTIDKFIGDSIMAYWNAPADIEGHATKAVDTALEQLYEIKDINKRLITNKKFEKIVNMCAYKNIAPLEIGIGINTGDAVIGEMGSLLRSDYTIIGDNVNLGFKLESLCKYYGSKCNISNFTKWQLEDKYIFRYLDLITVKGHSKPLQVWEVIDFDNASIENNLYQTSRENLDNELALYHRGLNLYQDGLF